MNSYQDDLNTINEALEVEGDTIHLTLPRSTVETLKRFISTLANGHEVIAIEPDAELSPNEAAEILGVSRPFVRKLMNEQQLDYRKVGAHHRIPMESIEAYREREKERKLEGMRILTELSDEMGWV